MANIVLENRQVLSAASPNGDKMDVNEEQLKKIKSLYKWMYVRFGLATLAYIIWLFLTNLILAILGAAYPHNESIVFFCSLGVAVLIFTGLHGTIKEIYNETVEKAKKVLNS
jgi:hypothetical protein